MNKRNPIIIGLLLTLFALWLLITSLAPVSGLMSRLENIGYDLQLRSRLMSEQLKPTQPVAIIDIDDRSLGAVGRWPWSRAKLAELVTALGEQGVAVIAFDIFFSEKQTNIAATLIDELKKKNQLTASLEAQLTSQLSQFNEDSEFAKSLEPAHVVLAFTLLFRPETQNELPAPLLTLTPQEVRSYDMLDASGYIGNIPVIQQAAKGGGFINVIPDDDGIIRHVPMVIEYKGRVYPSLALQAVKTYLGDKVTLVTGAYHGEHELEGVKVGRRVIPTDVRGFALIPFVGKSYTFPYYSAVDVLNKKIPTDALLGKIVFVGSSATGLGDLQPTSIQNPYPGVEIQATLASGILENAFPSKPTWTLGAKIVLTCLAGLISAFLFPYFGPRRLGLIVLIFPVLVFYANNLFWQQTGLIISLLMPSFLVMAIAIFNILYGYLFESRRREQLKEIFGQYVPEKHINEMLRTQGDFSLRGEDREMTVMFADIQNFTTISEGMPANELVEMLNLYFTPMTEVIHKHVGTVDKYVGDQIIAFWGAPLQDKHHVSNALKAAVEMQTELTKMREKVGHKWPPIHMGIGINTGVMSVGDMGSRFRRNYTVLGDSVNLASRVEGLTRYYGVTTIVAQNAQQGQTKFVFRSLDKVVVKGKHESVNIYELVGAEGQLSPIALNELTRYHQALALYYQQQFEEALAILEDLHREFADRKIYTLYIDRIREYKLNPPPKDWDGVYRHLSK